MFPHDPELALEHLQEELGLDSKQVTNVKTILDECIMMEAELLSNIKSMKPFQRMAATAFWCFSTINSGRNSRLSSTKSPASRDRHSRRSKHTTQSFFIPPDRYLKMVAPAGEILPTGDLAPGSPCGGRSRCGVFPLWGVPAMESC